MASMGRARYHTCLCVEVRRTSVSFFSLVDREKGGKEKASCWTWMDLNYFKTKKTVPKKQD